MGWLMGDVVAIERRWLMVMWLLMRDVVEDLVEDLVAKKMFWLIRYVMYS